MMTITRTAPRRIRTPQRTLDQAFEHLWRQAAAERPARYGLDSTQPVLRPPMDVLEDEHKVTVRLDLPGLTADDVRVEVDGDLLTIHGAFENVEPQEGERFHVRERAHGAFKRSLRLAEIIDVEHIEAAFANGVLTLTLPKRAEAQPRRIEVRVD